MVGVVGVMGFGGGHDSRRLDGAGREGVPERRLTTGRRGGGARGGGTGGGAVAETTRTLRAVSRKERRREMGR